MTEPVPTDVRALIRERIQALEQLEVLLLLHDESARSWSAEELASQLQLAPVLVEAALAHLSHHGLIASDGARYRYQSSADAVAIDALARNYQDARVDVIALISSDAVGRLRGRVRQLRDRLKPMPSK